MTFRRCHTRQCTIPGIHRKRFGIRRNRNRPGRICRRQSYLQSYRVCQSRLTSWPSGQASFQWPKLTARSSCAFLFLVFFSSSFFFLRRNALFLTCFQRKRFAPEGEQRIAWYRFSIRKTPGGFCRRVDRYAQRCERKGREGRGKGNRNV